MSKATAPKPNIEALQDAVFKANKDFTVHFSGANGIEIITQSYCMSINDIMAISFRLYGRHDRLRVEDHNGQLLLDGATYYLLPEFLIEGETVEFELFD